MNIGERIKFCRECAKLTQDELGKRVGVTGVAIMRYEKGTRQPSISQLLSIASALDTSLTELLGPEYGEGALFSVELSPELIQALGFPSDVNKLTTSNPELMLKIVTEFVGQSPAKVRLNLAFDSLNDAGQKKAIERVEELTEVPKYQQQSNPTDTIPEEKPPENQ